MLSISMPNLLLRYFESFVGGLWEVWSLVSSLLHREKESTKDLYLFQLLSLCGMCVIK